MQVEVRVHQKPSDTGCVRQPQCRETGGYTALCQNAVLCMAVASFRTALLGLVLSVTKQRSYYGREGTAKVSAAEDGCCLQLPLQNFKLSSTACKHIQNYEQRGQQKVCIMYLI